MKLFQVTHNSPMGVKLTAEVIAPTADEAVEAFYKGQVRTQEVERSASSKDEFIIERKKV
jgi:hypothetical protein